MNTKDNNEEFQFHNDEWNEKTIKNDNPTKDDTDEKRIQILKNNKPDGRRYKK